MRLIRFLLVLGIAQSANNTYSQNINRRGNVFNYEIVCISEYLSAGDTINKVQFVIDTSIVNEIKELTVTGANKEILFTVNTTNIPMDSRFVLSGNKYYFDLGVYFSDSEQLEVKGKNYSDQVVLLNSNTKNHSVIQPDIPRNLKRAKNDNNPIGESDKENLKRQ